MRVTPPKIGGHLFGIYSSRNIWVPSNAASRSPRIDDAALITPATGDLVGVPPEVPELGAAPANNEAAIHVSR